MLGPQFHSFLRWRDGEFHFQMISDNFSLEILIIFPMPHWHVEYLILIINKMHKNGKRGLVPNSVIPEL